MRRLIFLHIFGIKWRRASNGHHLNPMSYDSDKGAIRHANKLMLDQFGLTNHRLKITYVLHETVRVSPEESATERMDERIGPHANRKEKYLYSSVDSQKSMSITLDIRDNHIFKAEIEASSQTLAAGKMWSQQIRASIPSVKVLINGQEN